MRLILAIGLLVILQQSCFAEDQTPAIQVKLERIDEQGNIATIDLANENVVQWLRDAIAEGQNKVADHVARVYGPGDIQVELISTPHPEYQGQSRYNRIFVQVDKKLNPAALIPLLGNAATQELDVYASLQVKITKPAQDARIFTGSAHETAQYQRGFFRFTSALLEAMNTSGKKVFDEAINQVISAISEGQPAIAK